MIKQYWLTKTTFEKNADDGIKYFSDRKEMANSVFEDEECGGFVQVYMCVPVSHEVIVQDISIELDEHDKTDVEKSIGVLKSHGFYTEAGLLEETAKELNISRKLLQNAEK